ncbi:MAG: DNA alkylation repair protein [Candidatus Eisenbacteria bacterium]|nr:DNA alkylation repair protein [Candidatus Eisenbacteria bacterium]
MPRKERRTTAREVLAELRANQAGPGDLAGMARFGIVGKGRLGIRIPVLRAMAKHIGPDHALALALWDTDVPDARILASLLADPARLTVRGMDAWVRDFDSWDVCDQVCLNLFCRSPRAWGRVAAWTARDGEFVRRAGFALIACLATHDRESPDSRFAALLPRIEAASTDGRNFVKKSVNWALRGIGKRNAALNRAASASARRIAGMDSKSSRWIASDALRELESAAVRARLEV